MAKNDTFEFMSETMGKYVDVILPLPLMQDFTYEVGEELANPIEVGCRVIVPFGSKKMYSGIIKSIHNNKPDYETKFIISVLDEQPIISPVQYHLWHWISQYYLCSEGEVMKASLPSGLKLESQSKVKLNNEWEGGEKLTDLEDAFYRFLYDHKSASITQLNNLTKNKNAYRVIKNLMGKGVISVEEKVAESYKPKTKSVISIAKDYQSEEGAKSALEMVRRAKKQEQLLLYLFEQWISENRIEQWDQSELIKQSNSSSAVLKSLIEKGILIKGNIEISRLKEGDQGKRVKKDLNEFQQKSLDEIKEHFNNNRVVLFHGVTASGKTEVYIDLIRDQMKKGKQVLYLVPEIVVATQLIDRLTEVFGDKVGVYHSKFNDAERVEIWNKLLDYNSDKSKSAYQIIIGARSALLLPFKKLGLIIVDEEHENTYKQFDPAPRYQARDASIVLASLHKAQVLLGSATPSFESYYNAFLGKYGYVHLKQRHHQMQLPEIEISDLKRANNKKLMRAGFGPELFSRMEEALENKEQVILFQNRRGYAPFLQCEDCGWIPSCKNCDVSLTYHKFANTLNCHYCGYTMYLPSQCGSCKSTNVHTKGLGTEKIEDDVKILFPEAKTGRLDLDSTRGKHSYQKLISNFTSGKIDILIGTQMVTKGLDFDNVNVIGVLNADMLMNYPDFRSYERAFHLMAQVSGRAGRKNKRGQVVIQTYNPDHPLLDFVKRNDFNGLFKQQIAERKYFKYPPVFRLIYISIKHMDREKTAKASNLLANLLKKTYGASVLGPEYPVVARKHNRYEMIIRLKMERSQAIHSHKIHIINCIDYIHNLESNSNVQFTVDVDPF